MIYIGAFLAVLWSAGCTLGPVFMAAYAWREGDYGFAAAFATILFPVGAVFAAAPWLMYADTQSPVLATLHKNAWQCGASHTETTTTYVKSGNVLVPMTTQHQVCDQYVRAAR